MFIVKSVDETKKIIDENFSGYKLEAESVKIKDAVGRVLACDILSYEDIPGFNRSTVDGYAVISKDTFGASESLPAQLELVGEVRMGENPGIVLQEGQTVYVPTGGELPQNSDAVVMIEYAENFDDEFVYMNKPEVPGGNVVLKGDDIKIGSAVLSSGQRIRPQDAGMLAALGYENVSVRRKLRAGIISTGDEIVDINAKPKGSQVRDINSYSLYAGCISAGVEPKLYGIIKDDYESMHKTVENALTECDVVLISGGSSVGVKDHTFNVIDSMGKPGVLLHGIAVKPGKPTIVAKSKGKALFGLPGHPVSAFIIFKIFVCRLFNVINGVESKKESYIIAAMECNYPSNNGREEYLPVQVLESGSHVIARPVFGKSGLISVLSAADGYVHISRGSEGLSAGQRIEVFLF